jgi:hypothetical protein
MAAYDFRGLSSYDFELLVRDLLQRDIGIRLETFAPGKDQGIDIRGFQDKNHTLIVQCKHYVASGFAKLSAVLAKYDRPKVRKLRPSRYLLGTSVPMTPLRKSKLRKLFMPYLQSDADVLGPEDLNNLLQLYPSIERANFKLWLTSSAVLERVLHGDVIVRTESFLETLPAKARLYVQNASFSAARKLLEKHNVVVISGPPGIGKSMLASMLLIDYVNAGYQAVEISGDISEADAVYETEAPQSFYYDDFLGTASPFEKLPKNEDARLAQFIARVRSASNKRFIMTTREYILREAKQTYEQLDHADVDLFKYTLTLEAYSRVDRAHILYNHLYFSPLPKASIRAVVKDERYLAIIDHDNYSPRIIEYAITLAEREGVVGERFVKLFLESLDKPERLWSHAFQNQLDDDERAVLLALATLPSPIAVESVKEATKAILGGGMSDMDMTRRFIRALRTLEGTFIEIIKTGNFRSLRFADPSLRDYLRGYLNDNPDVIRTLLNCATAFEQPIVLWGLSLESADIPTDVIPTELRKDAVETLMRCYSAPPIGTRLRLLRELRLRLVLQLAKGVHEIEVPWLEDAFAELAAQWDQGGGDKRECVSLLTEAKNLPPRTRAVIRTHEEAAREWFTRSLNTGKDYARFRELAWERDDLISAEELEAMTIDFEEWFDGQLEELDITDPVTSAIPTN